jgi:phage gpG-like protein
MSFQQIHRPADGELVTEMRSLLNRIADLRPFYRYAASRMRQAFRENFAVGGRPPWRPLAPSTVAAKHIMGLPAGLRTPSGRVPRRLLQRGQLNERTILILTGELRDSVSQKNHPHHITRISKDRVEVGTSHPLAPIHEFGTRPYWIFPRRARALRFVDSQGRWVYRRRVYHPGVPARPFLRLTQQDEDDIHDALFEYLVDAVIRPDTEGLL